MAKKYIPTLRDKIYTAFGRINKVILEDSSGKVIYEINGPEEFMDSISTPEKKRALSSYTHRVEPKNISEKNPMSSIKSSTSGYRQILTQSTMKNNIRVTHGGKATQEYGETLSMPSSARSKFLRGLGMEKDSIMARASDKDVIEIARRKDAARYYTLLNENQLDEYNSSGEKAEAVRQFVKSRDMTGSNKSVDGFASGIVWDVSKEVDSPEMKSMTDMLGSKAYENLDSTLRKNRSNERGALKILQKKVRKTYGSKGTATRKEFDDIKDTHSFRTDVETMKYLDSDEGRRNLRDRLETKVISNDMRLASANNVIKDLHLGSTINKKDINIEYRNPGDQKIAISNIMGYTGKSGGNSLGARYLYDKFKSDPEAIKILQTGTDEDIRSKLPDSIDFSELVTFKGDKLKVQEAKHFREAGIDITGLPPDLEAKLENISISSSTGSGGGSSRRGPKRSSGGKSSGKSGRTQYSKGGSLLGHEEITYVRGVPVTRKRKGRIAQSLSDAGGSIKSKIVPSKRDTKKIYNELKDRRELNYLTDEELRYAATAGYATRKRIIAKGERLYRDPAYRAKKFAKQEETKGIYEAKLAAAQKRSKRRMSAATSPWWKMWYSLTHNLVLLTGIAIALSLLFLPIGLFHVIGWAIAVGLVSLVMFVIWVFIELWWLIAQALVAVINLLGQAVVSLINWVGYTVTTALGQSFTPFEHVLVQNMNIVEIDPITGKRTILGITWGQFNLVPPDFLKLNEFMPTEFDTDTIITKIFPAIKQFFVWYTAPLADRWTDWIATAPWYTVGAVLGIPLALLIIAVIISILYVKRRMY